MADTDFFDKSEEKTETTAEETEAPEAIKVGEKAYTQEELNRLVQLGEIGREAEEKFNVKIDRVWPNLQQTINEKKALEDKLKEFEQVKVNTKIQEGAELTPEEQRELVRKELKQHGAVLEEDIDTLVERKLQAKEIREDTQTVVSEGFEKYGIKTDEEALLDYMVETGIKNPQLAFRTKYEEQIDKWKEEQIEKARKPGMATDSTSSAGSKQPNAEPITKDNFFARMDAILDKQS